MKGKYKKRLKEILDFNEVKFTKQQDKAFNCFIIVIVAVSFTIMYNNLYSPILEPEETITGETKLLKPYSILIINYLICCLIAVLFGVKSLRKPKKDIDKRKAFKH